MLAFNDLILRRLVILLPIKRSTLLPQINKTMSLSGMNTFLRLILSTIVLLMAGCNGKVDDYIAASSITSNGFARTSSDLQKIKGQEVKVWGFVDHSNLYGDEEVKQILGDWWSGDGPNAATWRFNLMANENDEGYSFSVHVPNDGGRDDLLSLFLADARAQRPTKVFLEGTVFTFDAPANTTDHIGLYMKVSSSLKILLEPPKEKEEKDRLWLGPFDAKP